MARTISSIVIPSPTYSIAFTQGYKIISMDFDPYALQGTLFVENDPTVTLNDTVGLSVHISGDTIEDGYDFQFALGNDLYLYANVVHN